MLFIGTVDCKIRKICGDRLIKVQKTVLDSHQHTKGCKTLGHGLNAENSFRVYETESWYEGQCHAYQDDLEEGMKYFDWLREEWERKYGRDNEKKKTKKKT